MLLEHEIILELRRVTYQLVQINSRMMDVVRLLDKPVVSAREPKKWRGTSLRTRNVSSEESAGTGKP